MRTKLLITSIFLGVALWATPLVYAQTPSYLECGHCDPTWTEDQAGCSPDTGCIIDIKAQLKQLPYFGAQEVAKTTPLSYWSAAVGIVLIALIIVLI